MSPETKLVAISVVFLGFAYFWVYPRMTAPTGLKIMWRDAVISCAALMFGAYLFAGTGQHFDAIVFQTNWFIYQLIILAIIEAPLFLWFAYKYDLEF